MDFRLKRTGLVAGAGFLGLFAGHSTVAAMDPLPVFLPARPIEPYTPPQTVPADQFAYPASSSVPITPDSGARPYRADYSSHGGQPISQTEPKISGDDDPALFDDDTSVTTGRVADAVEPAVSDPTTEH